MAKRKRMLTAIGRRRKRERKRNGRDEEGGRLSRNARFDVSSVRYCGITYAVTYYLTINRVCFVSFTYLANDTILDQYDQNKIYAHK